MKRKYLFLYLLLMFLPYITVLILCRFWVKPPPELPEEPRGYTVTLYRTATEKTEVLALRDYLFGVLAGEMPASYPEEALKAQVVASYSYLLHRKNTISAHPTADFGHPGDICDDPNHCKAFATAEECEARWGKEWRSSFEEKLKNTVEAVLGYAVLYEGEPANTVFHAFSGGATEDAADVWGAEVPYLKSTDSHWDQDARDFSTTVKIPLAEFQAALEITGAEIGAITLTRGGSVGEIAIGGKNFTGRRLREKFGLRSTRFTLEIQKDQAVFTVSGYGHQVGMSQYGASVLAQNGFTFREILSYYYKNVTVAADFYA